MLHNRKLLSNVVLQSEVPVPLDSNRASFGFGLATKQALINLHIGSDALGGVLGVQESILEDAVHAVVQGQRLAIAQQVRTPYDGRVHALNGTVIKKSWI